MSSAGSGQRTGRPCGRRSCRQISLSCPVALGCGGGGAASGRLPGRAVVGSSSHRRRGVSGHEGPFHGWTARGWRGCLSPAGSRPLSSPPSRPGLRACAHQRLLAGLGSWGLGHRRDAALRAHLRLRPPELEPPRPQRTHTEAQMESEASSAYLGARLDHQPVRKPAGLGAPGLGGLGGQGTLPGGQALVPAAGLAGRGGAVAVGSRKPLRCAPGPPWAGAAPSPAGHQAGTGPGLWGS